MSDFKSDQTAQIVTKICGMIMLFSGVLFIFAFWNRDALPKIEELNEELFRAPVQSEIADAEVLQKEFNDVLYLITPRFDYKISGVVVGLSDHDRILGFGQVKDPLQRFDVCLVWGDNLRSGVYLKNEYEAFAQACVVRKNEAVEDRLKMNEFANNHLLVLEDDKVDAVSQIRVGDQVTLTGQLVDYETPDHRKIQTSTTRDDVSTPFKVSRGKGSDEVILLNRIEVLAEGSWYWRSLYWGSLGLFAVSTIIKLVLFFTIPSFHQ